MYQRTYGLYVSTFRQAQAALERSDEPRLRSLCSEVAGLGGVASSVSMLALSDAECGRRQPRSKSNVIGMFWRDTLATSSGGRNEVATPAPVPMQAA